MQQRRGLVEMAVAFLVLVSAPAVHASGRARGGVSAVKGVVNINDASLAKLVLLPYVGRGKAQAIVRYRKSHRFSKPADLVRVAGIGRKTFVKIKMHVTVTGPTTIRRVKRVTAKRRKTQGKAFGKTSRPGRRRGGKTTSGHR